MDEPAGSLNDEVHRIWNLNAEWWDDHLGDGNAYQCELIEPATLRLLDPAPDQTILDLACGAGRMARLLAERGAQVVAVDFSERFLARAKARGSEDGNHIDYRCVDATNMEELIVLTPPLGLPTHTVAVSTAITKDTEGVKLFAECAPAGHLELTGVFAACHGAGVPCGAVLGVANRVGPDAHIEWKANNARVSLSLIETLNAKGVFDGG